MTSKTAAKPTVIAAGATPVRDAKPLPPQLVKRANESAERWANRVFTRTREEHRRIAGGWPGTITEARGLVSEEVLPRAASEHRPEIDLIDREEVVRFLYQRARSYWIRREVHDVEVDDA